MKITITDGSLQLLTGYARRGASGSTHPLDQKRWYEFLLSVYPEHSSLSPRDLASWLMEEAKWPEETAYPKAVQYEFAMELLDYQAGERS